MKFRIYVPVDVVVNNPKQLRDMWLDIIDAGASQWSTDGSSYNIRTDLIKLKDLMQASLAKI